MERMKIILKHFIVITLLLLIPVVALCCEKESPLFIEDSVRVSDINGAIYKTIKIVEQCQMPENLNISHVMNKDLIREPIILQEWRESGIEYESAWSYKNNESENWEKTRKKDNWGFEYDPIGFDVFLFVQLVFAGTLLIISGIMTYYFIHDNPLNNLRYEKKN